MIAKNSLYKRLMSVGLLALCAACQQMPAAPTSPAKPATVWTDPQIQALRELGFVPIEGDEWSLNLAASVLFDFDSEQLRPLQRQQLDRIGRTLAQVGVKGLRVEGHTDNVGDADYNRRLSLRRASAVAQVLAAAGLPRDALATQGHGSAKPIADNTTEAGRAQNRRVVLIAPSL